jgi:hypothetical protein
MKKLVLILLLVFGCSTHGLFEFVNYKQNGALATPFIQQLIDVFGVDTFFETGTYDCSTTLNVIPYFKSIITVELHKGLYEKAKNTLAPYSNVRVFFGDSPTVIQQLVPKVKGTILFWLDAHCSGAGTALNGKEDSPDAITAIRAELKAIKNAHLSNCVILIDDIRDFGSIIDGKEFLSSWPYPALQEIRESLLEINPNFAFALLRDILLAYDKYTYKPTFSDTVIACTTTRLYDGTNLTDTELLACEETIQSAPDHEKEAIKSLYLQTVERKDPMFWHDLWYGLTQLGSGNPKMAFDLFSNISKRMQHRTKTNKPDNTIIEYSHPRIEWYMKQCQEKFPN